MKLEQTFVWASLPFLVAPALWMACGSEESGGDADGPSACSRDDECKGDRICEKGACVSPGGVGGAGATQGSPASGATSSSSGLVSSTAGVGPTTAGPTTGGGSTADASATTGAGDGGGGAGGATTTTTSSSGPTYEGVCGDVCAGRTNTPSSACLDCGTDAAYGECISLGAECLNAEVAGGDSPGCCPCVSFLQGTCAADGFTEVACESQVEVRAALSGCICVACQDAENPTTSATTAAAGGGECTHQNCSGCLGGDGFYCCYSCQGSTCVDSCN